MLANIDRNLPSAQYHAKKGISQSVLNQYAKSPAHGRYYETAPKKDATDAQIWGTAFHYRVLQPDSYKKAYVIFEGATRRGKEWDALEEEYGRDNILKRDTHDQIEEAFESLMRFAPARNLIEAAQEREVSIFWQDKGLDFKARLDGISTDFRFVLDLKTARDASPFHFERSIGSFGYHVQGGMYKRAAWLAGYEVDAYAMIVMEKRAPWVCSVFNLKDEALNLGIETVDKLIALYKKCQEAQSWPGYSEVAIDISVPEYIFNISKETEDE